MNKQFFIFTDGSAIGNPGPAGWAAIVIHGTKRQEIAGSVPWSTVSEMELRAAVEALRLTPTGALIELCSDSELLIDGTRNSGANSSNLLRDGRFVGAGFAATAAIRFSPAPISLPIRPHEPKLAACPWLPSPTIALIGTNLLENHDDRWQYAL